MIITNNATCNTGHLHISSLTHSDHGHHLDYEVNYNLYSAKSSAKSLHLRSNKLNHTDNMKDYLKMQWKIWVY